MIGFEKVVEKARDSIKDVMYYIEKNCNVYEYLCESLNKEYLTEKDICEYIIRVYDEGYEIAEPKGE